MNNSQETHICPSCGSDRIKTFHNVKNVPVHSCLLMQSREQALKYPKGDIQLGFCRTCGFVYNIYFNPAVHEYSSCYEETQGFSRRFNEFLESLASGLIEKYNLRNKKILEIGCGKGEFLVLMCELGNNYGIGIDPSNVPERIESDSINRIEFIQDFYSTKYTYLNADMVCCRHTLEHIFDTRNFMRLVRESIGSRSECLVFFELPDVGRVLREGAFWDIYYEHCSYFSPGSLSRLFQHTGFDVINLSLDYDDQYILLDAIPNGGTRKASSELENDVDELKENVKVFQDKFQKQYIKWKNLFAESSSRKVVLWGSGSKAVAFLTTLDLYKEVEYVVDINPYRHGKYIPGTGQKIVSPEFLIEYKPDLIVVMNPIYCNEISSQLKDLGIESELLPV